MTRSAAAIGAQLAAIGAETSQASRLVERLIDRGGAGSRIDLEGCLEVAEAALCYHALNLTELSRDRREGAGRAAAALEEAPPQAGALEECITIGGAIHSLVMRYRALEIRGALEADRTVVELAERHRRDLEELEESFNGALWALIDGSASETVTMRLIEYAAARVADDRRGDAAHSPQSSEIRPARE